MKQQANRASKCIVVLSLTLMFMAFPSITQAADKPRVALYPRGHNIKVGDLVTVDVEIKGSPTIYGADVGVAFDPVLLEVIDADEDTDDVQVEPGDFIDPDSAFILQNRANNELGKVDYALTLINPAPPVQGNGLLLSITFRAKSEGQAMISVVEGLFGTQTGETIAPSLESTEIRVRAKNSSTSDDSQELQASQLLVDSEPGINQVSQESADMFHSVGSLIAASAVVGVTSVGTWAWVRHTRRKS